MIDMSYVGLEKPKESYFAAAHNSSFGIFDNEVKAIEALRWNEGGKVYKTKISDLDEAISIFRKENTQKSLS